FKPSNQPSTGFEGTYTLRTYRRKTMDLTKEQAHAVTQLLGNLGKTQVQTLGGYAGTGKSMCVRALHDRLPGFTPCAFTGKAALVLQRKGMHGAGTIHGKIYHTVDHDDGGPVEWVLKSPHELGCRGFLVDEASMVGPDLYRDLLSYEMPV